ncbi:MAG TPA: ribonuclease HII [Bryobacteraceae bacterium]|nr:ribonuclease HII [Bryobacteraceae bacterium]
MRCQGKYEREARAAGFIHVAGADEVGRGALFGPVFAAAVILSPDRPIRGLRDSKQLPKERREVLAERIRERAIAWAVAAADAFEIDRVNIYQASRIAMRRAIQKLNPAPDYLLIDAITVDLPTAQRALIHGDALSQCIAAASILAKVERDACMCAWDQVFPQYGLKNHKGYSTDEHWKALETHGPTPLHRFSFWPVREVSPHTVWTGYPRQGELFGAEEIPAGWTDAEVAEPAAAESEPALQKVAACSP